MSETFRVRVLKESLVFSAAHFITYAGNVCERLHGHNYRVEVEVEGPLDDNWYVVDFIALRDSLQRIVAELDHHMLLPTGHPLIHVAADEQSVEVRCEERRWVFPRGDCLILPVQNTTAELLARYIGRRLLDDVEAHCGVRPRRLRVGVDECQGQWGICDLVGE